MKPHHDKETVDRERGIRASKGPSNTFSCKSCGKFRQMAGRKVLKIDGKRVIYQCAECAAKGDK